MTSSSQVVKPYLARYASAEALVAMVCSSTTALATKIAHSHLDHQH